MPTVDKKSVKTFQRYFLVGALLVLLVLLFIFATPFLIDLFVAAVIVTAVYPIHKLIIKGIPFSRTLAATVSMLLTVVVILLPFSFFGFFIAQEATDAYQLVSGRINEIVAENQDNGAVGLVEQLPFSDQIRRVTQVLPFSTEDLLRTVGEGVGTVSSFLLGQTTNILRHLSVFLIHIIIFLISLFFFLKDGDRLVAYVRALMPLSKVYRQELFGKLTHLSYGIIYGIFGAAILQGLLVGVGFAVAGFNNAAFWGVIAALFSPVPYIGTSIIWIPAVIILAVGGKYLLALLLALWCILIVGTADNFIKPFLIGSSAALNPLAVLIVLLGGTFVFGFKGLVFGPFVLTITLAFLHIYQLEYKEVLEIDEKYQPIVKPIRKRKKKKSTR